ncbi:hypothetical protein RZS28_16780 [Methylocapsa polymorpha]|uniref:Uncharacterized protein n=1 Tax=Methylocapsa polymorpha TaxID=3080828 RepID=A0ABZ0HQ60_9HYPH|nr:hypothetical protein RZS28_16780 [Methylocapsa sp. RX1]
MGKLRLNVFMMADRSIRVEFKIIESAKNSEVLGGSEQRRGWLKDRVEGRGGRVRELDLNDYYFTDIGHHVGNI